MGTLEAIFAQLGANGSILTQFTVVLIMFILTKLVLFNKLQFVIENREDKTIKLESSADDTFEKVNKLSQEYKDKIDGAHVVAQIKVNDEKQKISNENNQKFKSTEAEIEKYVESSRVEIKIEIDAKELEILSEADELASSLVEKLTV
jgi:F-type H+-transporting ATPase subunit b